MSEHKNGSVTLAGYSVELRFPSLRRMKSLGQALGINVMNDPLENVAWGELLTDDDKVMEVLDICVALPDANIKNILLDNITATDVVAVVTSFFMRARKVSVSFTDGLENFNSIYELAAEAQLQKAIPLTRQSTLPAMETPGRSNGAGTTSA